jgi:EAL domain-containing protein (putative c-di-GMP-specific phosphodiesterase class I)
VIQAAGRQIAAWRGTPLADVPVSVNVSPLQLRGSALVRTLNVVFGQTGVRPDQLEIEVTEHALVDSHHGAGDTLRDCHRLGVGIALDDFGTGYSSLSVLHQHPISRIKIDQSFCRRLPEDPKATAIVRAMIDMARNLSVGVVAEGIETEAQAACLRDVGCQQVQGFLFAPPASAQATEAWWQSRRSTMH